MNLKSSYFHVLLSYSKVIQFHLSFYYQTYTEKIAEFPILLLMESPWIFNIADSNRNKMRCIKTYDYDKQAKRGTESRLPS